MKEYVVEVKEGRKWVYKSDHKNYYSAIANLEALSTSKSVRIKQKGTIIQEHILPDNKKKRDKY